MFSLLFIQICHESHKYPLGANSFLVSGPLSEGVLAGLSSVIGSTSDLRSRGGQFESQLGHMTFMEIDHEIISAVIFYY